MTSPIRVNFPGEIETLVNKQIYFELLASYTYLSVSFHFHRDDVAMPGFRMLFKKVSDEKQIRAEMLMKFMNKRGGKIVLMPLDKPEKDSWGTIMDALKTFLELEKKINTQLIMLFKEAEKHNDVLTTKFIVEYFLSEEVDWTKRISDHITQMKLVGPGIGEYIIDREILKVIGTITPLTPLTPHYPLTTVGTSHVDKDILNVVTDVLKMVKHTHPVLY